MLRSLLALMGALIVILPSIARAEPKPEFLHGYALGHAYLRNQWTMVKLRVANQGDEATDLDAILTVRKRLHAVKYSKSFHLPPKCERTVWFYGQLGENQSYPVELINQNGAKVAEGAEWSNVLTSNRLLTLRMDDDEVLPSMAMYLGHRKGYRQDPDKDEESGFGGVGRGPLQGAIRRTATLSTRLPAFPDYWAGLDSISAVALGELAHKNWRPRQIRALKTWMRSGGVLLVFPGEHYERLEGSRLEELLPVQIFGSRRQNKLSLRGDRGNWDISLEDYVHVLETEKTDGDTVLTNGELPMVVEKRYGLGAIYFFAFPGPALDQWENRGTFLARLLRTHERLKPLSQTGLLEKGPEMLDEVAGAEVAPRSFVVYTLGGFFVLALVSLLTAHWVRRTELAWAVIVPAGVVVALISYRVGGSYREKVGFSLNEIAILSSSSESPLAFRSAILGLHTEETLRGEFVAGRQGVLFTSIARSEKEGGEFTTDFIEVSPRFRAKNMEIQAGAFPRYVVDSLVGVDEGLKAELQLGPDGLSGTVANRSNLNLDHCMMAINSYPFTSGQMQSLNPGSSVNVRLNAETMKSRGDFTTEVLLGTTSRTRKRIIKHLFTPIPTQPFNPWTRRLFLLGWPDRDFISESLEGTGKGNLTKRSISLMCVEATVKPAEAGQKVRIPRAFSIPALRPGRSPTAFRLTSYLGQTMPPETGLLFYLPPFASNVDVERATLHLQLDAYGQAVTVNGVDQETGEKVRLARLENPTGRRKISIPQAGRFQDNQHGMLVLDLTTEGLGQSGESTGQVTAVGGASWGMQSASVTLEGTAR